MTALEATLAVALLAAAAVLPFHLLIRWDLGRRCDARGVSLFGMAIDWEELEATSREAIGRYQGCVIPAAVQYAGISYRFDRIAPRAYRRQVGRGELFLDPGLVYVADQPRVPGTSTRSPSTSSM